MYTLVSILWLVVMAEAGPVQTREREEQPASRGHEPDLVAVPDRPDRLEDEPSLVIRGFYLPLMIVLWLLMLRGLAVELRSRGKAVWSGVWDGCSAWPAPYCRSF